MSGPTSTDQRLRQAPIPRGLVAREAMLVGLAAFERDPASVLSLQPAPRGPRPGKKKSRKK